MTPSRRRRRLAHALACGAVAGACTGPSLWVDNPSGHPFFVDGRIESKPEQPFRYYGATRIDVLPKDRADGPDWGQQPASIPVAMPAPASPWLFPLDFPVECVRRALLGREDRVVAIELPATGPELQVHPELRPTGLEALGQRAAAARIAR